MFCVGKSFFMVGYIEKIGVLIEKISLLNKCAGMLIANRDKAQNEL